MLSGRDSISERRFGIPDEKCHLLPDPLVRVRNLIERPQRERLDVLLLLLALVKHRRLVDLLVLLRPALAEQLPAGPVHEPERLPRLLDTELARREREARLDALAEARRVRRVAPALAELLRGRVRQEAAAEERVEHAREERGEEEVREPERPEEGAVEGGGRVVVPARELVKPEEEGPVGGFDGEVAALGRHLEPAEREGRRRRAGRREAWDDVFLERFEVGRQGVPSLDHGATYVCDAFGERGVGLFADWECWRPAVDGRMHRHPVAVLVRCQRLVEGRLRVGRGRVAVHAEIGLHARARLLWHAYLVHILVD
jgi:hypothetical protein